MSKGYKVLIAILAVVCSLLAACIGFGIVGSLDLTFSQKFICNFVFMMQFMTAVWCAIALFRKQ